MRTLGYSRSLRGNVDRNNLIHLAGCGHRCRSLRGNVDRNIAMELKVGENDSRSLRGNVDRNSRDEIRETVHVVSFPTWERG